MNKIEIEKADIEELISNVICDVAEKIFPKIGSSNDPHEIGLIDKIENMDDFLEGNGYREEPIFSGTSMDEIKREILDFLEVYLSRLRDEYDYFGMSESDTPDRDNAMFDLIERKCLVEIELLIWSKIEIDYYGNESEEEDEDEDEEDCHGASCP
jgi:hypothetical protein